MAQDKDLRKLIRDAEGQGWKIVPVKAGYRLLAPNGRDSVTVHSAKGDPRAIKNVLALMRRMDPNFKHKEG